MGRGGGGCGGAGGEGEGVDLAFRFGNVALWCGLMRRKYIVGLCGALLLAGGEAPAAEAAEPAAAVSRGEDWLGEGSDLGVEVAHVIAAGKKGNRGQARRDLEGIAAEAEVRGLKQVWLQAQQWWVRFTLVDQPEVDLTPAVDELREKVVAWGLAGEEAEIYGLWAEVLKGQGQWLMALKAQDRVSQLALDAGRVPRAVEAFLEMARLCRGAAHGWRLGQVWARLDQVRQARPGAWPEALEAAVAAERAAGAALLGPLGRVFLPEAGVDLQPRQNRVLVSSSARELGRSRFLLTNATAFTVEGRLGITAKRAAVSGWQSGESGLYVSLAKGGAEAAERVQRLLPGQQLEVYVEHEPSAEEDEVRVVWQGGGAPVVATGTFYFADGLPATSVVNAGVFQLHAGWCIPLYHEIYQRGLRARVQNVQVQASAACRLELYDHDTGRLLAVDADGDGAYGHAGDQVVEDADRDGWPDLVIGDRARAIEICAWPLGVTGSGLSLSVGLRAEAGGAARGGAVENTVIAAGKVSVQP